MRGFESHPSHYYQIAAVAQLGERQTEDLKVPGSIPGVGICMIPWRNWITRLTTNQEIAGSSPVGIVKIV